MTLVSHLKSVQLSYSCINIVSEVSLVDYKVTKATNNSQILRVIGRNL